MWVSLNGVTLQYEIILTVSSVLLKERPEAEDCIRNLFLTDPYEDRKTLIRKRGHRAQNTCEWITGTEEITSWVGTRQFPWSEKSTEAQFLWLHGNPGTGKSTMAVFLTEYLAHVFSATAGKTLVYFFCDSGSDKRRTATSIMRGLLLQLLQQHPSLVDYVLPKYKERGAELFSSFDALWTIFMAATADPNTGRTYCVIDALDECDEAPRKLLLREVQETFLSSTTTNMHILITSRRYPNIEERLIKFPNRNFTSFLQIQNDINQCIEEKVEYLTKLKRYTDTFKGRVKAVLQENAEKTFLWIALACRQLEDADGEDAIAILKKMPEELHLLYKSLLDKASGQNKNDSKVIRRILSCVAISQRPLSIAELSDACQMYQYEDDLMTRYWLTEQKVKTFHLLLIVEQDKVLLLHKSVRDFITGSEYGYAIDLQLAHAKLSYRCINTLIKQFHGWKQRRHHSPRRHNFASYACEFWANHAHSAQTQFKIRETEREFFEFDSPCREYWLNKFREHHWVPRQFSILHVAAKWGIPAIIQLLFPIDLTQLHVVKSVDQFDLNIANKSGNTPLDEAAMTPHIDIVKLLLRLETKVTSETILLAARNGMVATELMTLFLEQRGYEITITENLVEEAVRNNKSGLELMKLLFDRRESEIPVTDAVVTAAASHRSRGRDIFALLLERRGNEVKITDQLMKVVAANAGDGYRIISMLLRQRGDEINITEEFVLAATRNEKQSSSIMMDLIKQQ